MTSDACSAASACTRGSDIDSRAAAALDDTDAATAHRALTALYDQYLLS